MHHDPVSRNTLAIHTAPARQRQQMTNEQTWNVRLKFFIVRDVYVLVAWLRQGGCPSPLSTYFSSFHVKPSFVSFTAKPNSAMRLRMASLVAQSFAAFAF